MKDRSVVLLDSNGALVTILSLPTTMEHRMPEAVMWNGDVYAWKRNIARSGEWHPDALAEYARVYTWHAAIEPDL
jgi:hypothetical protein